jgi:hypothetical protein
MAVSGKGQQLTGLLLARRGRRRYSSTNPLVKERINDAGPIVLDDWLFDPSGGGGTIYTLTAGGTITFTGTVPLIKTNVVPASGTLTLSGGTNLLRTRAQPASGTITFVGGTDLRRTRVFTLSGNITFSGTAPITFVPGGVPNIYTLSAGGTITFSGNVPEVRTRVFVPTGQITFTGTVTYNRTRAINPTGSINFTGNAPIIFNGGPVFAVTSWRTLTGSGK